MKKRLLVLIFAILFSMTTLTGCFGDKGCFGNFAADQGEEWDGGGDEGGGSGGSGEGGDQGGDQGGSGGSEEGGDQGGIIYEDEMYVVPNEFRFAAYSTPPNAGVGDGDESKVKYDDNPDYNTPANWQTLKACGFNWGIPIYYDMNDDHILTSLASAEAAGVKILITNYDRNPDSLQQVIKKGWTYSQTRRYILDHKADIKAHIDQFTAFESFGGIFAADEPSTDLFPAIAAAQDWFEKEYPQYEFYVNLLPVYASAEQLFGSDKDKGYTYEDHVAKFVDIVNPFLLSYDHYPFVYDQWGNKTVMDDTIYNMLVFAEQARRINVPWFIYLQSLQFYTNSLIEYLEEWSWQCYAALACGAKGIQSFCYWTLLSDINNIEGGIVDRDGTPTDRYDWVQETFSHIMAIENLYCSYTWEGAMSFNAGYEVPGIFKMTKDKNKEISGFAKISKVDRECNTLIGQFGKEGGKKAYMVTNLEEPFFGDLGESEVTLTFSSDITKVVYYYQGQRYEENLGANKKLTLNIAIGQGCFVMPE